MSNWQNYKPREGLSLQEVEGELVILDQRNRKIHQLNPAASVVWRSVAEQSAVDSELALAALLDQFDVKQEAAAADLDKLLQQFVDLKLLVDESSNPD